MPDLSTLIDQQKQIVEKMQKAVLAVTGTFDVDTMRAMQQSLALAVDKLATLEGMR